MRITVRPLNHSEFQQRIPELVDVYIEAMDYDPQVRDNRIRAWQAAPLRKGFLAVGAFLTDEEANIDDRCIGISYGAIGQTQDWWFQHVYWGLDIGQRTILRDYFEIAEVHISPEFQGRGIGKTMLTSLITMIPTSRALLSTPEVEKEANGAFGLYRKLGFYDLLRHFYFPGDNRPFAILGINLPLTNGVVA